MNSAGCRFCTLPEPERIVQADDSAVAMLSLGPLVEGYSLVLPRRHIACVAEIPKAERARFLSLVNDTATRLGETYGNLIAFEHGRATCSAPSPVTHCHHAHLHLVPTSIDLVKLLAAERDVDLFSAVPCTSGDSICTAIEAFWQTTNATGKPYLIAMSASGAGVHFIEDALRPQYLRYLVARELGDSELANWVSWPRKEVIEAAMRRMSRTEGASATA